MGSINRKSWAGAVVFLGWLLARSILRRLISDFLFIELRMCSKMPGPWSRGWALESPGEPLGGLRRGDLRGLSLALVSLDPEPKVCWRRWARLVSWKAEPNLESATLGYSYFSASTAYLFWTFGRKREPRKTWKAPSSLPSWGAFSKLVMNLVTPTHCSAARRRFCGPWGPDGGSR